MNNSIIVLGLIFVCLLTRIFNLTVLPIFTDESIYIYWAKLIQTTHSQWFISLYDGKPPLLIWAISLLLTVFPQDWYLIAGRLPSVLSGIISLVGIYKISFHLFKIRKIAIISAFLYIIFPFNLLYDRLALFDSLFTSMLIWSVYYMFKTAENALFKNVVIWGLFLGFAFLSKPPALIFVLLTYFCFIILSIKKSNWKKIIFFPLIAVVLAEFINNLQRVSDNYPLMVIKNQQFQQTFEDFIKNPFGLTFGNLNQFFNWIISYYTFPVLIFGIIAFITLLLKYFKIGITFVTLWFVPLIILAILGKEIFPRYILFITPYFIIPSSYLVYQILIKFKFSRKVLVVLFLAIFFLQLKMDYNILTNPPLAEFPKADYNQLISEHPSGYGLDKIFSFLDKEAESKKIVVVTQGTFGLYPYAFYLHYWDNKNVTVIPRWPLDNIDSELYKLKAGNNAYIILKEYEFIPGHLLLKEIIREEKPNGKKYPIILTTFL